MNFLNLRAYTGGRGEIPHAVFIIFLHIFFLFLLSKPQSKYKWRGWEPVKNFSLVLYASSLHLFTVYELEDPRMGYASSEKWRKNFSSWSHGNTGRDICRRAKLHAGLDILEPEFDSNRAFSISIKAVGLDHEWNIDVIPYQSHIYE